MLKAYSVFADGFRHEHAELVFAKSGKEAKKLGWKMPHGDFGCDWTDLRVLREERLDRLAQGKEEPFVCRDDEIFRDAEWRSEDLPACASCGLTDFSDGKRPEWKICPDCGFCGECGHDDCCIVFQGD
jgi:hypothetical protein